MAMNQEEIRQLVEDALPGASVEATDLTGTRDHWHLLVIWPGFQGLPLLQQHKKVMDSLQPHLEVKGGSGRIHAVQIKTAPSL